MNLSQVFIGKPLHWLLWLIIAVVLYLLGRNGIQVRYFVPFCFVLLILTAVCLLIVLLTYKTGERITREPFDE